MSKELEILLTSHYYYLTRNVYAYLNANTLGSILGCTGKVGAADIIAGPVKELIENGGVPAGRCCPKNTGSLGTFLCCSEKQSNNAFMYLSLISSF